MKHISATEHYDLPIERLFDLAINHERIAEYMPWLQVGEIVGRPDQVGSTFRFRDSILGRTFDGHVRVVDVERPVRYTTATVYDNGVHIDWKMEFRAVDGGTDVSSEVEYEIPGGIFGHLVDRLYLEQMIERRLRHSSENFRGLVEAEARQPILV